MNHRVSGKKIKRPFPATILLTLTLLLIVMTVGCTAGKNSESLTPPPGFQPLAEADLSSRPFDGEILGEFTLDESAVTTIFYTLPNIDTAYFALSLIGPGDSSLTILHSENYRTDENGGGTWEKSLAPGTYQLILTVDQSPGILSVYWKYQ